METACDFDRPVNSAEPVLQVDVWALGRSLNRSWKYATGLSIVRMFVSVRPRHARLHFGGGVRWPTALRRLLKHPADCRKGHDAAPSMKCAFVYV